MIGYYCPYSQQKNECNKDFVFEERIKTLGGKESMCHYHYHPQPGKKIQVWEMTVKQHRGCGQYFNGPEKKKYESISFKQQLNWSNQTLSFNLTPILKATPNGKQGCFRKRQDTYQPDKESLFRYGSFVCERAPETDRLLE